MAFYWCFIYIGKSALKKTVYGECYNPTYKPTLGIDADPSITRISFKQYREWVLQNASKADTRRLNLEYIDIIIDYVLNALQQPWVSDDAFDVGNLHIGRSQVPTVGFNPADTVIPHSSVPSSEDQGSGESGEELEDEEVKRDEVEEEEEEVKEKVEDDGEPREDQSKTEKGDKPGMNGMEVEEDKELQGISLKVSAPSDDETGAISTSCSILSATSTSASSSGQNSQQIYNSVDGSSIKIGLDIPPHTRSFSQCSKVSLDITSSGVSHLSSDVPRPLEKRESRADNIGESFLQARGELSRLLVENIPREILKRMVIRWPVGDEPAVVSRAELNRKRLMITVWEVSGDPIQQNFTPFFFSHRCLFVSMYNLTRQLDDPCQSYVVKNLRGADGNFPSNAEVLEEWLGYSSVFCKPLPSVPFRCTDATPVLPPIILACSFADEETVRENPINFHKFFGRQSFSSYRKHLVESSSPSALIVSSKYENEGEEDYAGHHLLRREIDHLARQMPFCRDSIPIQWVKFEQLIYGLQEQKKIIVLYDDITRYVAEHCNVTGTLQFLPILSHFHDVGVILYFYRHPLLSNIVITKPQWLADALSAVIGSYPGKWVTTEVQVAFKKLAEEGIVTKEMLLLAYRCGRMHQRYWSETLFILNCMDLVCCHPSCHDSASLYIPCLVTPPLHSTPAHSQLSSSTSPGDDPAILHFSNGTAAFPIAMYNQFVVRCVRNSHYTPQLFYCSAHIRLSPNHHLILRKHRTSISLEVQRNHLQMCPSCASLSPTSYPPSPKCSQIQHILEDGAENTQSDNTNALIEISKKLKPQKEITLSFSDDSLDQICPRVLEFARHHLDFLTTCWFPGLRLELIAAVGEERVTLDQQWRHNVLRTGTATPSIRVWFK